MLYVRRSSVDQPKELRSATTERLRTDLIKQVESGERPRFNAAIWNRLRPQLEELFRHKCAYCESPLGFDRSGSVTHFRPKESAVDLSGKVHPGYWWLAYEWQNLYLACGTCVRYKRNRFPLIDESRRIDINGDPRKEPAVLIDPCDRRDFTQPHLVFGVDGRVAGATDRGNLTIEILGLNRTSLVEARRAVATEMQKWGDLLHEWSDGLEPETPYLGMILQLIPLLSDLKPEKLLITDVIDEQPSVSLAHREDSARRRREAKRAGSVAVSARGRKQRTTFFAGTRRIEKVEINNFKGIRDLTLQFPQSVGNESGNLDETRETWLALLGENATGKSSVLQAIALALMGDEQRTRLQNPRSGTIVYEASGTEAPRRAEVSRPDVASPGRALSHGANQGRVSVFLTSLEEPVELIIGPSSYTSNTEDPMVLLLGYGSTRLLRTADEAADDGDTAETDAFVRLENLFDPFAKLNNVECWAGSTSNVNSRRFAEIADALIDLLHLDAEHDRVFRRNGSIKISRDGRTETLRDLSDGYAVVVALAMDIMLVVSRLWKGVGSIRNAEGVVLIDEIGVHLHPRWQMEIVPRLRRVFPNMQFVTTTHQPLCLRGLGAGEVVLMQRDREGHQIEAIAGLPSPSDLRVDQLLTSEFFGLFSTSDPEVEKLFTEYYRLLAVGDPTASQKRRVKQLQRELKDRRHLGSSPREELMYEVIDKLLAHRKADSPTQPIADLKPAVIAEVREAWRRSLSKMGADR